MKPEPEVVSDFINKNICPYCGGKLHPLKSPRNFDMKCEECSAEFDFIDSPGPDGYYMPRDVKDSDYCYTGVVTKSIVTPDHSGNFSVLATNIVIVKGAVQFSNGKGGKIVGSLYAHYDFSNLPEEYHELALTIINSSKLIYMPYKQKMEEKHML